MGQTKSAKNFFFRKATTICGLVICFLSFQNCSGLGDTVTESPDDATFSSITDPVDTNFAVNLRFSPEPATSTSSNSLSFTVEVVESQIESYQLECQLNDNAYEDCVSAGVVMAEIEGSNELKIRASFDGEVVSNILDHTWTYSPPAIPPTPPSGAEPSPPSWLPNLPSREWRRIGVNVVDDVKFAANGTYPYNTGQFGQSGFGGIINAWNGGAYASGVGQSGSLLIYGGGHKDYWGQ